MGSENSKSWYEDWGSSAPSVNNGGSSTPSSIASFGSSNQTSNSGYESGSNLINGCGVATNVATSLLGSGSNILPSPIGGCCAGAQVATSLLGSAVNNVVKGIETFLRFGGTSLPVNKPDYSQITRANINTTSYKGYIVTSNEMFDALENLANELWEKEFNTHFFKKYFKW